MLSFNSKDYNELSTGISIKEEADKTIILVNEEWTFEIPNSISYTANGTFDTGLDGSIDIIDNNSKSLVLDDYSGFYFKLEQHNNFFGQFYSVIDCRYDNRLGDGTVNRQIKYQDTDELYVDLFGENVWPFGLSIHLRVRGENITPYDFTSQIKPMDEEEQTHIKECLAAIANSIKLVKKATKSSSAKKKKTTVSDPDFIVSGTVLQKYIGNSKDIVVPEGVTELADSIFSGKIDLRSIVIPEGVKRIGYRAFENCVNLEKADLPDSLEEIGDYAFVDCHKLKSIYLSDKIMFIESSVFSECYELENVELPANLEVISHFAFKNCRKFTDITIPVGVKSIGNIAFANCINLKSLYIPDTVTNFAITFMDQHPFDGSNNLIIKCPKGSEAEKFAKQHGIKYEIDNSVRIRPSQKKQNISYSGASFSSAEPTPKNQTAKTKDKEIKRGTGVSTDTPFAIKDRMFAVAGFLMDDDTEIRRIIRNNGGTLLAGGISKNNLPDYFIFGVDTGRFQSAKKLADKGEPILLMTGPEFIEKCNVLGIENAQPLKGTYDQNGAKTVDGFTINNGLLMEITTRSEELYVPEGTLEFHHTLKGSPVAKKLVLPDGFEGEIKLYEFNSLEEIDIPGSVRRLHAICFMNCCNLRKITLHEGLRVLQLIEFSRNPNLTEITIPKSVVCVTADSLSSSSSKTRKIVLNVYKGSPAEEQVRNLMNNVSFSETFSLKIIDRDPDETFFPYSQKEAVFEIEDGVLKRYTGVDEHVVIPDGVKMIDKNAFEKCYEMRRISIPESVTKIETEAFIYCIQLENVTLPKSVKTLGKGVFRECHGLCSVDILGKIKTIKPDVFKRCTKLSRVSLPAETNSIGDWAFWECTSLKKFELPEQLAKLGWAVFHLSGLEDLYIPATISSAAFDGLPKYQGVTFHVALDSEAEGWAKANNEKYVVELTEEQKAAKLRKEQEEARRKAEAEERKRREEEARRKAEEERIAAEKKRREELEAKKKALQDERRVQEQIVAENKGIFGEKARKRKAAQARIAEIDAELGKL